MEADSLKDRVGDRLRGILKARGLSIRHFSDKTGIPYRTLQDYLGNRSKPNAEQLQIMADHGINVHYLMSGRLPGYPEIGLDDVGGVGVNLVLSDSELFCELENRAIEAFGELTPRGKPFREFAHLFRDLVRLHLDVAIELADVVQSMKKERASLSRIADVIAQAARPRAMKLADAAASGPSSDHQGGAEQSN